MISPSRALLSAALACSCVAFADGLDRDSLLTEAPATPAQGSVRVSGGGNAAQGEGEATGALNATLMWTPVQHLAGDLGAYWQDGKMGPSARARYQLLSQDSHGVDLAVGARFKMVAFTATEAEAAGESPPHEAEVMLSVGRRFGAVDVILNAVAGTEVGGPGKDAELKLFAGYRLSDALRVGVDSRVQTEFWNEEGAQAPNGAGTAFAAGPAVSWLVTERFQVQALAGASKARGTERIGPTGRLSASFDF